MVILLTGASGFIGRHLAAALETAGHQIVRAARRADAAEGGVPADFTRDFDPADWLPRLAGVDAVINAVGILRERGSQSFEAIHERAPQALFAACAAAGVKLVIQVSALGADEEAASRYHLSKKAADDYLLRLNVPAVVVQPSLVYGPGGASARLFALLASLPVIPLPGHGQQRVQPIHIDDLVAAILALLDDECRGQRVAMVGPRPVTLRDMLGALRARMALGRARFLDVPLRWVRLAARMGESLPGSMLDRETLQMLERGNTADASTVRRLLGRDARPVEDFIAPAEAPAARLRASLDWLLPLMRLSIALVWIVTGILSLGIYPVEDSYALLARVGVAGWMAPLLLYGAALLDVAIGIGILALTRRRSLWLLQATVILLYTAIITWKLPEFWLHPYGPILKNLPMLAGIWLLYEMEEG